MTAKRNKIISELSTCRFTKAKPKKEQIWGNLFHYRWLGCETSCWGNKWQQQSTCVSMNTKRYASELISKIDSVHTRGIVKTSRFRRHICNKRWFIRFKGSRAGIPKEQALLRKSKPPENARKVEYLSLGLHNATSLHIVDTKRKQKQKRTNILGEFNSLCPKNIWSFFYIIARQK